MDTKKVFHNAKWIVGCKIIQSLLNLIVGMLSARYLGPANYGLINYAASIVGVFIPIMQLGMRSTLVQEYISRPDEEGSVMGSALVMSLVSSLACMVSIALFTGMANPGDKVTFLVVVLYSCLLPFQAIEMIQYWFQAKLLSKYPSVAMLAAYVVVSIYKIYLLMTQKSVYWFALSHAVEYMVSGILLLVVYSKKKNAKITISFRLMKALFNRSKYYIVSSIMVTIFANTDHLMLTLMIGTTENGIYSAAFTSAGVLNFVYAAIIDSARPAILTNKYENEALFQNSLSGLYCVITYIGLLESLFFTILAKPIVAILYGNNYMESVPVLQIVVWYIAFSYIGTVRNVWILAENKQKFLWIVNLCGALMNILLNVLFIPVWGACGAAFASVLTQFFTNVVVGFLIKPIRKNNELLLKGLNPRLISQVLHRLVSGRRK